MKILVSMSTSGVALPALAKGGRVVVKAAKDEWYIGTITHGGANLSITFDDGMTCVVKPEDREHVRALLKPKKLKRALTDVEAAALTIVPKTSTPHPDPKAGTKVKAPKSEAKLDVIRLTHNRGHRNSAS